MKLAKFNEIGRSMVEMLGVLAIIGVLSVGAIAGYSKAMFKYKMNKTLDVLSHVITRVTELSTMNVGDPDNLGTAQYMIDYGFVSECEPGTIDENLCKLPVAEFQVVLYEQPEFWGWLNLVFDKEPFDSCVAFLNSGLHKNVPEEWWSYDCPSEDYCMTGGFIVVSNDEDNVYTYGTSSYWKTEGAKSELNNTNILEMCSPCQNQKLCYLVWHFNIHAEAF